MFKSKSSVAILLFLILLWIFGLIYTYLLKPGFGKKTDRPLCENCNIVIIDIDMLRADAINCKNAFERTPNICKLAGQSVYFKNHISHSDLSIVSQVSTFTSLYPSSH